MREERIVELEKRTTTVNQYHFDMETVLVCAMIAVMAAIGITAGIGFLFNIQIVELGWLSITGIITGLSGIIWGALIFFNMN